ncbi:rod shape-determining protein [Reichenbachiella sp.]
MGIFDLLSQTIAIEAGSSYLRIIKDGNIVFNEPTLISVNSNDGRVSGVGDHIDSKPPNKILEPFNYVISDFMSFESCLRGAINKIDGGHSLFPKSYKMFFSIPIGITEIEKRAFRDAAEHAGAKEVYMIYSPCCTALGLSLLLEVKDFLIVDFSKSKFEFTIFSNSRPVSDGTLRLGTQRIESLIRNYVERIFGFIATEDEIQQLINSAFSKEKFISLHFSQIELSKIEELLEHYLAFVIDEISSCVDAFVGANKNAILGKGIYFTGGGTMYNNICNLIAKSIGLTSHLSSNPTLDNINGLSKIMSNPKNFQAYLMV